MTDWLDAKGRELWNAASRWVAAPDAGPSEPERLALALQAFAWQRRRCAAIDRIARAFTRAAPTELSDIPGVPTDAFKTTRIACFAPDRARRTFRTSGTTAEARGVHEFADTSLYAAAAVATAARDLFTAPSYRLVLLAEPESQAPESSLSFMVARFAERWCSPGEDPWAIDHGRLDAAKVLPVLRAAREPIALLGASFALVHLVEAMGAERIALPAGSIVMPTGGFKGRSRELAADELFATIAERFGVDRPHVVQEYGMTELSSQAYERFDRSDGRYVPAPWMHVVAVDPDTLHVLPHGRRGLLKVIDLLNLGSSIALQTSDLGTTYPDGFVVHGRAPGATPRGCARAIDALLSDST